MSSSPLPPYFNINPDAALEDLGSPTTSQGFADIARACEALVRGRRAASAQVFHMGNHPLSDPRGPSAFPARA